MAEAAKGFSSQDLQNLYGEAVCTRLRAIQSHPEMEFKLHGSDLQDALHVIRPSNKPKGKTVQPVLWSDIGGLEDTKELLRRVIEWPLRHAAQFSRMNLPVPKGILLYGPPGCCKVGRLGIESSRA